MSTLRYVKDCTGYAGLWFVIACSSPVKPRVRPARAEPSIAASEAPSADAAPALGASASGISGSAPNGLDTGRFTEAPSHTEAQAHQPRALSSCPPKDHEHQRHCLIFVIEDGTQASAERVAARLRSEGYAADVEASSVSIHLTDSEIEAFLGGTPEHKPTASSSGSYLRCLAYVGHLGVPPAYDDLVSRIEVGHQICE